MRLEDLERDIASKHAGSSQQKLYDDRNHRDPMLTASSQNAFAHSQACTICFILPNWSL